MHGTSITDLLALGGGGFIQSVADPSKLELLQLSGQQVKSLRALREASALNVSGIARCFSGRSSIKVHYANVEIKNRPKIQKRKANRKLLRYQASLLKTILTRCLFAVWARRGVLYWSFSCDGGPLQCPWKNNPCVSAKWSRELCESSPTDNSSAQLRKLVYRCGDKSPFLGHCCLQQRLGLRYY